MAHAAHTHSAFWQLGVAQKTAFTCKFTYSSYSETISKLFGDFCSLPWHPIPYYSARIPIEPQDGNRVVLDDLKSSVSDYFPMIKRGHFGEEKEDEAPEVVTSGWKHEVASRREREEGLR